MKFDVRGIYVRVFFFLALSFRNSTLHEAIYKMFMHPTNCSLFKLNIDDLSECYAF